MSLTPQELDWMQRYASGAPPEQLRSEIPMMYEPPDDAAMQAAFGGPDPRRAQNMSVEPTFSVAPGLQNAPPPAPPPVATDAGGMSMPPAPPPVASEALASTVSPAQLQQMGREAEARLAAQSAPQTEATAVAPPQTPVESALQRYLMNTMRGSPGRIQPGGEQLAGRTVERELRGRMSPEIAEELENANIDQQGLAVAQGELQASGLESMAAQQRKNAQSANLQLAKYNRDIAAKETERDIRNAELDDMRADIKRNPASYWSGETGKDAVKAIGLTMLGILGGPRMILQVVEADIAHKEKSRDLQVNMLQDRLSRFEKGLPSPESAQMYRRSLAMDAMASEAEALANSAKSEEVRQRGYAIAEQYRIGAIQAKAAAETGSLGKEKIETKNMPAKVVGGKRGGIEALLAEKDSKLTPEQKIHLLATGKLPGGGEVPQDELELARTKYERSVAVRLPNGETAYASDADQKKEIQGALMGSSALQNIYEDLARIRDQHAVTGQWDRKALGRAKVNVSKITLALKKAEQLGVLSQGDLALIKPLTGGGIEDFVVGPQFDGALERSRELNSAASQSALQLLSSSPWGAKYITAPPGGAGSTAKPRE